jgi:hypothetical protein
MLIQTKIPLETLICLLELYTHPSGIYIRPTYSSMSELYITDNLAGHGNFENVNYDLNTHVMKLDSNSGWGMLFKDFVDKKECYQLMVKKYPHLFKKLVQATVLGSTISENSNIG